MPHVYLALYKGQKQGKDLKSLISRFLDYSVRKITKSPYSHCEIAIKTTANRYKCYSSSARDKGVRCKAMELPSDKWDLISLPESFSIYALKLFKETQGEKYDYLGVMRFILPFIEPSQTRWFCSEWCAEVLGFDDPEEFSPQDLADELKDIMQNDEQ
ncbi:MAG: hypothetical protein IJR46_02470 [Neisseriaceae bacterium]|nr:hypothetical protein [Neisseriaceae bacterium]